MWSVVKPIVVGGWASVEVIVEEETEAIVILGRSLHEGRVEGSLPRIYQRLKASGCNHRGNHGGASFVEFIKGIKFDAVWRHYDDRRTPCIRSSG